MKYFKYNIMALGAMMLGAMLLTACNDDDAVDPYDINYCYLYQPNTSYASIEYKATGDFISSLDDPLKLVPVRLTKPAPKDMSITVDLDSTVVDDYNEANGTDYKFLKGARITNSVMHIAAGGYITPDSIEVSFADRSFLVNNTENLILPVVIKNADGLKISNSSRIFLIFKYKANIVELNSDVLRILEKNWSEQLQNLTVEKFLSTDWAADEAISVSLSVDSTLIESYNSKNNTYYKFLSGAHIPDSVSIKQGEGYSDLTISLDDINIPFDDYVLPIRATAISGNGVKLGDEVAYIVVIPSPGTCSGISSDASSSLGVTFTCDNWHITVNGVACPYPEEEPETTWNDLFDGYASVDWWNTGDIVRIDLGEEKTVTGFSFRFYQWYYGINGFTSVRTSSDGKRWSDWGEATAVLLYSKMSYFEFDNPPACRFLELTVGGPSYSDYYGIFPTGVELYEKN